MAPLTSSRVEPRPGRWTPAAITRAAIAIIAITISEMTVLGLSAIVPVTLVTWLWQATRPEWLRPVTLALAMPPAYGLFALILMTLSTVVVRATGARTPPDAQMRIADMEWPLLNWARYMASTHVVRLFVGSLLRGTPVWTTYLRLNGARLGRRVYVNSLFLSDYNLLTFGHDVVIGAEVHLSGHTVEQGVVKTGTVTLGDGVTIGLSTIVEIDVEIGPRAQIGALSFVPKHARLEGGEIYVGIPVKARQPPAIFGTK